MDVMQNRVAVELSPQLGFSNHHLIVRDGYDLQKTLSLAVALKEYVDQPNLQISDSFTARTIELLNDSRVDRNATLSNQSDLFHLAVHAAPPLVVQAFLNDSNLQLRSDKKGWSVLNQLISFPNGRELVPHAFPTTVHRNTLVVLQGLLSDSRLNLVDSIFALHGHKEVWQRAKQATDNFHENLRSLTRHRQWLVTASESEKVASSLRVVAKEIPRHIREHNDHFSVASRKILGSTLHFEIDRGLSKASFIPKTELAALDTSRFLLGAVSEREREHAGYMVAHRTWSEAVDIAVEKADIGPQTRQRLFTYGDGFLRRSFRVYSFPDF